MAQLEAAIRVDIDVAPARATLRRLMALAKDLNIELAKLDENQQEYIAALEARLAEFNIRFQLEERPNE